MKQTQYINRIGGVMVSMLASSAVGHGFKPKSGQTKDYGIGICCFSAKHAALLIYFWESPVQISVQKKPKSPTIRKTEYISF
jgi:hypothetical protein